MKIMKKSLLYLLMLFSAMNLFTACSSDEESTLPIQSEIAGVYKGSLDIVLDGNIIGDNVPKNITITKAEGNAINMELKNFSFMGMQLGTISVLNCKVTLEGAAYKFTGAQTLTSLPQAIGECPITVEGSIVNGVATIKIKITVKNLNQQVDVTYEGKKLSDSESAEYIVAYDFENWTTDLSQDNVSLQYPILKNGWASCNQAVSFIKGLGSMAVPSIEYTGKFPINKTTEAHSGTYAAEMISVDTKGGVLLSQKVPKVTAGSLFLGTFNAMAALQNPMATTQFGNIYTKKPLTVKGFFKYTAGSQFYNADGQLAPNRKDACSISAVLYEVSADTETLDGNTIYNSDKIVASKVFTSEGASAYTPFTLDLNYIKEYDSTKKYKFAIIFSASKDGATYNAAIGSRLVVDDVTVTNE